MTVYGVLRELVVNPREMLIRQWNWKSALFSSTIRAAIFLCTNLTAGWRAATGAMLAEFIYRVLTSGFYGSITQAFRLAEPPWAAGIAVMIILPVLTHSLELAVHLARGTPKLFTSIVASVCFTAISTLFNLYAMRRGALVVGDGSASVASDMRRMPRLIAGFVATGPMALHRWATSLQASE